MDLKDIVAALESVRFAAEKEGKVRKIGNLVAVDGILPVP